MMPTTRKSADLNSAWPEAARARRARHRAVPRPSTTVRRPSWLTVPNARMRLRSVWRSAWKPPSSIVKAPRLSTIGRQVGATAKTGREARDEVDAGLHHGRGVQVGAHRGGRGHRAGQPEVEREDRRLAERADQHQHERRIDDRAGGCLGEDPRDARRAGVHDQEHDADQHDEAAEGRDEQRLQRGASADGAAVVVADQQVRQHAGVRTPSPAPRYAVVGRVPRTTVSWVVWPSRRTSRVTVVARGDWLVTMSSGWVSSRRRAVDGGDDVAGLEAALVGRAAGDDRARRARRPSVGRDPGAVGDRQAVGLLDGGVDRLEADAEVRAGQRLAGRRLGHERAGDVDRDGEADALAVAGDRRC